MALECFWWGPSLDLSWDSRNGALWLEHCFMHVLVEVKTLSNREDDNNKQNLNNDGGDGNNNGQENQ